MSKLKSAGVLWLIGYLASMAIIVWLLWETRSNVLSNLNTEEQRQSWRDWTAASKSLSESNTAPVERRAAHGDEAPDIVLLRDYFGAIVATCLAIGTVLFVFIGFVLHGISTAREPVGIADVAENSGSE